MRKKNDSGAVVAKEQSQIRSTGRSHHSEGTGTVKFFNTDKGFGFIKPDQGGSDVFVHISAVQASGLAGLTENQKVTFETALDRGGHGPTAINLAVGATVGDRTQASNEEAEFNLSLRKAVKASEGAIQSADKALEKIEANLKLLETLSSRKGDIYQ